MADTTPARQIWAILAPLAALAGLAFLHYRRKGGVENEGKSIKKAIMAVESNIEEESISDENEELLHEDVEYEEALRTCEGDDADHPEEADSGFRTGENFEPKLEEVNKVEQESQKITEEKTENVKVEEVLKPVITKITINKKIEDVETVEVKEEKAVETIEEDKVIEEVLDEDSTEMEIVEIQSSPAVLQSLDENESVATETTYVEEKTNAEEIELESLESALEKLNEKSFEIIDSTESTNQMDERVSEMTELEIEPMTTIEEQTEPSTFNSGTTGGALMSRTRTESEVVREDCSDWANSPCMKLKNTPVDSPLAARKVKDTPVSSVPEDGPPEKKKGTRQRPSEIKSKPRKSFRGRIADSIEDEDRESTTTSPDSAKDGALVNGASSGTASSSGKRKKQRSRKTADKRAKNGAKRNHKSSAESSKGKTDSTGINDTSSDSGTHTDDNTETYVEISGFPTQLIGALIGKNGSNIKKLQTDSQCKIIVKNYPVESGEQYVSIEGTGKNVRKAVSILKKKFPDLNLADVNNPAQSESYPEIPQDYNEPYNYNEYWPGSVNNNILQVDLAEGVPVEVRVTAYSPEFPSLWLQPYTHPSHEKFPRLEANMSDFYSMDKTESILTNYLMIGDFAVCLHHAPDEITGQELPKWYRIQIIQYPDDNHVTVLYVDFGGYATVPIEMIRKLVPKFHPTFSQCLFQAICVTLDDVIPVENAKSEYITEAGVYLHDIIAKAPQNSIEATVNPDAVHNPTIDPNVPRVVLKYRNELGEQISINDILKDKCSILEPKLNL